MNALTGLGIAYHQLEQYTHAMTCHQQSLEIALDIGDRFSEGTALGNLAVAYQFLDQPEAAIHYAQQHLAIALEIGDRAGEVRAREVLNTVKLAKTE